MLITNDQQLLLPERERKGSHYPIPTVVVRLQKRLCGRNYSGCAAQVATLLTQRLKVVLRSLIAGQIADIAVRVHPRPQFVQ
jgi:hypothetical protein